MHRVLLHLGRGGLQRRRDTAAPHSAGRLAARARRAAEVAPAPAGAAAPDASGAQVALEDVVVELQHFGLGVGAGLWGLRARGPCAAGGVLVQDLDA